MSLATFGAATAVMLFLLMVPGDQSSFYTSSQWGRNLLPSLAARSS